MKTLMMIFGFCLGVLAMATISLLVIEPKHVNHQEYQIRLELDSAYIYDGNRLVGSCKHGQDGIDSVLLMDNL